jgi:hypothetical protein
VVLNFDATLVGAFSRKQGATGTFKGGFGHHPLLCYLDGSREALAGVVRDGNAGSNSAADHMTVGDLALAHLPAAALDGEIIARVDGAGATHEFTQCCRDANIAFSGGAVTQDVLTEALIIADEAWQQALCQDGCEDGDAWVAELTGCLAGKLATWPAGTRLICRAVRLAQGTQLGFGQTDSFRYEVFLTERSGDIRDLDLFEREHARARTASATPKTSACATCRFSPSPATRPGCCSAGWRRICSRAVSSCC